MKLIKYSKGGASSTNTNTGSGSGGGSTTISSSVELDRTIWGQHDEGNDIDGSMIVNGNVSINAIVPPTYDPDNEDGDGEDIEEETGGGNLNVELTITSDKTESNEVYAKNHLYVNYPHPNGTKQCVVDLIKNNADKIANNTTNITNLTATVNNHTTQINNLTTTVNNNTTEISNIKNTINNLNSSIGDLMPIGSIIMYNGTATSIPSGWHICDGTSGTPNLIDKFIRGGRYVGGTGGADNFTLSVGNLPPHSHKVAKSWYGGSDNANDRQCLRWDNELSGDSLTNQAYTENTGSGTPVYHLPPYYTLIYIMKIN